jgi:predicted glycoside hydrolase/deacetylase ChbG (UPF0249 family)/glycosyltransferase involved in cell wall biosynthesis
LSLDRRALPERSFILPVFNGERFLHENLETVRRWLAARPEAWELIVVDDASTDRTPAILEAFLRDHPRDAVVPVRFTENRGKGFATRVGLGLARGAYALFTDCDLAYPVENAARILEALDRGAGVAIACRVLPQSAYTMSPTFFSYLYTRHLTGRIFNWICRLLTVPGILDTQAGLKGFRTEVVRPLLGHLIMDGFSFDVELLRALLDRRASIVEVPVAFRYDSEPSTVRFLLDSAQMLRDLALIRLRSLRGRYRDARLHASPAGLIVHADDFGLAPGVNRAIEEGLASGSVTSASILLGGPHAEEALRWAAAHTGYDFGVHLNLTQGRPTLPPERVPSLVTGSGEFPSLRLFMTRFFAGRVRPEEIRAEWEEQIRVAREAGVRISHLDSHQHVHLLPRIFSRVISPMAREHGLAVRVMDGPVGGRGPWPHAKSLLLRLASRRALRAADGAPVTAHGFGAAFMREPTVRHLHKVLSRARPGRVYEFVVHPGRVDAALRSSGDTYIEGREREASFLSSAEFRAVVRHTGVALREAGHPSVTNS